MADNYVDLGIPGFEEAQAVGSGGAATVYRARQPRLNRTVAVKVIQGVSDPTTIRRFEREASALGSLSEHPGIVTLYSIGTTTSEQPYFVMQYCPKGSLQDQIDEHGPMSPVEACRAVEQIATTLTDAHARGIFHRDLKPANILVDSAGRNLVADFGIAALTDATTGISTSIAFTAGYVPPEVLQAEEPSAAGDVYSLGATLYALSRGRMPFATRDGDSDVLSMVLRIGSEQVDDLRTHGVPDQVATIVERCMAKDPAQRPSMSELAQLAASAAQALSAPQGPSTAPLTDSPTLQASSFEPPIPSETAEIPRTPTAQAAYPTPPTNVPAPPIPQPVEPAPQPPISSTNIAPPPSVPVAGGPAPTGPQFTPAPAAQAVAAASAPSGSDGQGKPWLPIALVGGLIALLAGGGFFLFGRGQETPVVITDDNDRPTSVPREEPTPDVPAATPTPEPVATATATPVPTATAVPEAPAPTATAIPIESADGTQTLVVGADAEFPDLRLALNQAQDGDVVRIEPGEYVVDRTVQIASDITIVGAGIETTIITGDVDQLMQIDGAIVGIFNLSLTSTFATEDDDQRFSALEIVRGADVTIDKLAISGSQGVGLGVFASNASITNSTFRDNVQSGVAVADGSTVLLAGNVASNNGESGFVWFDTSSGTATANIAESNGSFGFDTRGESTVTLTANSANDNGISGITASGSSTATLRGNRASNNTEFGFSWIDSSSGVGVANTATGNSLSGFIVSGESSALLTGNTSTNNSEGGFVWFGTASGTAIGNFASGNAFNGFAVLENSSPTLRANTAVDNVDIPFFEAPDSTATITDDGLISVLADGSGDVVDLAAALANGQDGDVIMLGPGTFNLDELIFVDHDVTIIGAGQEATSIVSSDLQAIVLSGVESNILNLSMQTTFETDNDDERFSVLEAAAGADVVIDNVRIADGAGLGIGVFDATVALSNTIIENNQWSGFAAVGDTQVDIALSIARDNGQQGFAWLDNSTGAAIGNTGEGNIGDGFSSQGESTVELSANTATDNQSGGFAAIASSAPTFVGNTSTNNAFSGFITQGEATPVLIANTSTGNTESGFIWFNDAGGLALNNVATGNRLDGFATVDRSTPQLIGNVASGNIQSALNVADGADPVLSNNSFSDVS